MNFTTQDKSKVVISQNFCVLLTKTQLYYLDEWKKAKIKEKVLDKSWSPTLIFFTEKKIRKIPLLMLKNDFENQNF